MTTPANSQRTPGRTAPLSWGDWPPARARVDAVINRALMTIAELVTRQYPERDVELELVDVDYVNDHWFPAAAESVQVCTVLGVGCGQCWMVYWQPDTDEEVLRRGVNWRVFARQAERERAAAGR